VDHIFSLELRALRPGGKLCRALSRDDLKRSDYAGMGPGRLAPIVCGWKRRTPLEVLRRALDNALAVLDVVTSRSAVSSDAKKGLGYVPDY